MKQVLLKCIEEKKFIMINNIFVDSNVWLYALLKEQNEHKLHIAQHIIQSKNIIISVQIINEVCYQLYRNKTFSEEELKKLITGFYKKYQVIGLEQEVLMIATDLRKNHKFSFWDSLVVACALKTNCSILYSEDMQHGFMIDQLQIINPFL